MTDLNALKGEGRVCAMCVARWHVKNNAQIKQTAAHFGISKSRCGEILESQSCEWRRGAKLNAEFHRARIKRYNALLREGKSSGEALAEIGTSLTALQRASSRAGVRVLGAIRTRRALQLAAVREVARKNPDLNKTQIAVRMRCSRATVAAALKAGESP